MHLLVSGAEVSVDQVNIMDVELYCVVEVVFGFVRGLGEWKRAEESEAGWGITINYLSYFIQSEYVCLSSSK